MTIERERTVSVVGAFRTLFDAHAARAVRFALLLGADDPEDVAQDAFCRLYARLERTPDDIGDAGAYLNRTIVNLVRDRHRRRVVRIRASRLQELEREELVPSPEEAVVRGADGRRVLEALDRVPERRREAIVLRFWLDLPYAEIADVMGVGIGTAKSNVSRGLDDLHKHLMTDEPSLERR